MSIPARRQENQVATAIEDVLIRGDLSKLNEQQRTEYYLRLCNSIGLNPMTQPFQYLTLNGKLVLYARRDCADQLRKINGISIEIVSQDKHDGLLSIHVRAKDRDGRMDEDLGVVSFGENLKGDNAANAILKAVTKAKRRVTLSLSGLGFLDETEVADIPASAKSIERQNPHVTRAGEIVPEVEYDEQGEPVNNIPNGQGGIDRLSKANARPVFARLQDEIRQCKTMETLERWGGANADQVATLPLDWQEVMRGLYAEQRADLTKEDA